MQSSKTSRRAITRLQAFQRADGGFSYWPGAGEADEWASSYAGHFLAEAARAGYAIPYGLLDQWRKYQRSRARSWVTGGTRGELVQAYRLYTLALAGEAELGAMNRLREHKNLPAPARWRLAAAYGIAGQPEAADALMDDSGADVAIPPYRELSNTYGSDLRDKALLLESAVVLNRLDRAASLAAEISAELAGSKWLSTHTTAFCLIAMARYGGVTGRSEDLRFSFSWNGRPGESVSSPLPVVQRRLLSGGSGSSGLHVTNESGFPLFPRLVLEGMPEPGKEHGAQNGMALTVKYLTPQGRPLDPARLDQGTDFMAQVTVKNTGDTGVYEEVALSHIIASGWEIHNPRLAPGEGAGESDFDYQDIRDDRIYTYFDIDPGEQIVFRTLLHASYLGRYYLPMVSVEAMYDATLNARVPGRWVEVVVPGENGAKSAL